MIAIPGDTPSETIAAIIADEMAIGVINNKTTGVRLIPVPGGKPGDRVEVIVNDDVTVHIKKKPETEKEADG